MTDNELKLLVLQKYYDARENGDFIPVNKANFGSEVPLDTVLRISRLLHESGIIEFKAFYADNKIDSAFGRINAYGIDSIEQSIKSEDKNKEETSKPRIFISYQTSQKQSAGRVKELLENLGIESFLAHEDIEVSQEWRTRIFEELGVANIFICLLSKEYYESPWCVQEAGIAAFRESITIIPISLDGEIPKGFIGQYQSTKLNQSYIGYKEILPGLIRYDFNFGLEKAISALSFSNSFRNAEDNFETIFPYINQLNEEQATLLLTAARKNSQIHHAALCAKKHIPPLLVKYGYLLEQSDLGYLRDICSQYSDNKNVPIRLPYDDKSKVINDKTVVDYANLIANMSDVDRRNGKFDDELKRVFAEIPERHRFVLERLYGLFGHRKQKHSEIAAQLNVDASRIKTVEQEALRMLENF
jgi:hypothetical protein